MMLFFVSLGFASDRNEGHPGIAALGEIPSVFRHYLAETCDASKLVTAPDIEGITETEHSEKRFRKKYAFLKGHSCLSKMLYIIDN